MSKILHFFILIFVLVPASAALGQEFTNETTVSGTFDGNPVEYYLATNKAEYTPGDSVWMKYAIKNISTEPVTYVFASMPYSGHIDILNGAGGLICSYSGGYPALWDSTLNPNESLDQIIVWRSPETQFNIVNPYYAVARPNTWDFTPDSISIEFRFAETPVLMSDNQIIPEQFSLFQNYPNPFNSSTTITYQLPEAGEVILSIYDVSGRFVHKLVAGYRPAGTHSVGWNTKGLCSGVYFYQLISGDFSNVKKCVLLK